MIGGRLESGGISACLRGTPITHCAGRTPRRTRRSAPGRRRRRRSGERRARLSSPETASAVSRSDRTTRSKSSSAFVQISMLPGGACARRSSSSVRIFLEKIAAMMLISSREVQAIRRLALPDAPASWSVRRLGAAVPDENRRVEALGERGQPALVEVDDSDCHARRGGSRRRVEPTWPAPMTTMFMEDTEGWGDRVRAVPRRRRQQQQALERVLGTPAAASATGSNGNVGSSIYYALGVTAAFAARPDAARLPDHLRRSSPRPLPPMPRAQWLAGGRRLVELHTPMHPTSWRASGAAWRAGAFHATSRQSPSRRSFNRTTCRSSGELYAAGEPLGHRRRSARS